MNDGRSGLALVVLDMLNCHEQPDAGCLTASVGAMIDPLVGLLGRAAQRDDVYVIYANDNHGDFSASGDDLVRRPLEGERPDLVKPIVPEPEWGFLTKGTAQRLLQHRPGLPAGPAQGHHGAPHRTCHRRGGTQRSWARSSRDSDDAGERAG